MDNKMDNFSKSKKSRKRENDQISCKKKICKKKIKTMAKKRY